jgi:hypothetical protein
MLVHSSLWTPLGCLYSTGASRNLPSWNENERLIIQYTDHLSTLLALLYNYNSKFRCTLFSCLRRLAGNSNVNSSKIKTIFGPRTRQWTLRDFHQTTHTLFRLLLLDVSAEVLCRKIWDCPNALFHLLYVYGDY